MVDWLLWATGVGVGACVTVALVRMGWIPPAGRTVSGTRILCPWHTEKTPSCYVKFGSSGFVHCFGCGKAATHAELAARLVLCGREDELVRWEDLCSTTH